MPNFPDALEAYSNYNDVVQKKKSTCWMEHPEWKEVRDMMFNLATLAMEYCKHLAKENEA